MGHRFNRLCINTTWGEFSSEWGELSSEGGASCLLNVGQSWGEFSLGRVVFRASCPDPNENIPVLEIRWDLFVIGRFRRAESKN